MTDQEMVEVFARVAQPRLLDLLKLKVDHVYDPEPGSVRSLYLLDSRKLQFKLHKSVQPYRGIERFLTEDKLMGYIINPGLLPCVKAIAQDLLGRELLVTRKPESKPGETGAVAHIEGFGMRIVLRFDAETEDTQLLWECLYGVL